MPKKKSYKINISFDEKVNSLSGIFGLSEKERDEVMDRFQNNIRHANQIHPSFQIAHLVESAVKAAESDAQLAYIMFRLGREHEQQNMTQAAQFAERIFKNGKKTFN